MKKRMRLMTLVLALGMLFSLCACGTESENKVTNPSTESIGEAIEDSSQETTEPTYTVTVVDEQNNPLSGVMLQLCLDTCVPGRTNENGVAEFFLEEATYKVTLLTMPEGYDYSSEEQEWYFPEGENTMTVVLKSLG
jgi:hypothetical protein